MLWDQATLMQRAWRRGIHSACLVLDPRSAMPDRWVRLLGPLPSASARSAYSTCSRGPWPVGHRSHGLYNSFVDSGTVSRQRQRVLTTHDAPSPAQEFDLGGGFHYSQVVITPWCFTRHVWGARTFRRFTLGEGFTATHTARAARPVPVRRRSRASRLERLGVSQTPVPRAGGD